MNNGKVNWKGSFPAAVTPFKKDGEIDKEKFITNLELMLSEGAGGFVISGCCGECWSLTAEERIYLFKTAVDVVGGRVPVIGGTENIRTENVIALSKEAKRAGVDGVMIIAPYFAEVNKEAVIAHYKAIAEEVNVPIMLYNHPPSNNINLDVSYLNRLVDLEWVVAIKESSGNVSQVMDALAAVGDKILVFTGYSARVGMPCVLLGSPGFVGAMEPQIMGKEGFDLFRLSYERKIDEAWKVQKRTMRCSKGVGAIGSSPANLKAAMNMLGRPGGFCRRPIIELSKHEEDLVRNILVELNLLR